MTCLRWIIVRKTYAESTSNLGVEIQPQISVFSRRRKQSLMILAENLDQNRKIRKCRQRGAQAFALQ